MLSVRAIASSSRSAAASRSLLLTAPKLSSRASTFLLSRSRATRSSTAFLSTTQSRPYSSDRKGKARESAGSENASIRDASWVALPRRESRKLDYAMRKAGILVQARAFHATARRDALPMVPAALAILKSTTLLTAITAISRVLISFFPIGTIAAFRLKKIQNWLDSDDRKPTITPEADEFYKMWCEEEKAVPVTKEDAEKLMTKEVGPEMELTLDDGRVAYLIHSPGRRFERYAEMKDPKKYLEESRSDKDKAQLNRFIRTTRFFLPPLPAAAVPYFERLPPSEQEGVMAIRKYWATYKAFKDRMTGARVLIWVIFILPAIMLLAVYTAALERVPLTGRWRIILLTPEEEDKISSSLAGANWYRSVINLLTTPEAPAPPVLPYTDWRWKWVEATLRRLESAAMSDIFGSPSPFTDTHSITITPPPAQYPLKPRPRVSSRLHSALPGGDPSSGAEHLEIGPPYSLMLMQKDEKNAFSYGFGGKGAGGIVVYSGLLDEILRESSDAPSQPTAPTPQPSGLSSLFSGLFGSGTTTTSTARLPVQPTEEQTLYLACVLAHEMGHLLLSHHLETLSQQQVLWPSLLGFSMDILRACIWPFTVFLGPTVNDALANVGKTSTEELSDRYGHIDFQAKHEYEADLAGLRILTLAGFDPKIAMDHFFNSVADLHEIKPEDKDKEQSLTARLFKLWTNVTHPSPEQRIQAIRKELERWESFEPGA